VRFTFGTFKFAVREPTFRLSTPGSTPQFPNTVQSLRKAVRTYHQTGAAAAHRALRESLKGPYWKTGVGAGKASVAEQLLDAYIQLDATDGRAVAGFNVKSDVLVGSDVIDVTVDLCLFGANGYAVRLVLWDTRACSRADARTLLAPCIVAVEQEFGQGAVEDATLFHIRAGNSYAFTRREALRGMTDVAAALNRAQQ
jgi:hypothetical protein